MSPQKLRAAALAAACLCVLPAGLCCAIAGESGDGKQQVAETKPVPLSADTVAEIQRAIDEERYLDAGNMLDQALIVSGGDARLLLLAGRLRLARGRYADALTSFKTIESDPKAGNGRKELEEKAAKNVLEAYRVSDNIFNGSVIKVLDPALAQHRFVALFQLNGEAYRIGPFTVSDPEVMGGTEWMKRLVRELSEAIAVELLASSEDVGNLAKATYEWSSK